MRKGHSSAALSILTLPRTCNTLSVMLGQRKGLPRMKTQLLVCLSWEAANCPRESHGYVCKGRAEVSPNQSCTDLLACLTVVLFVSTSGRGFLLSNYLMILPIFLKSSTLGFMFRSGELFRLNLSGFVWLISFADRLKIQPFSDSILTQCNPYIACTALVGLDCTPLENTHVIQGTPW